MGSNGSLLVILLSGMLLLEVLWTVEATPYTSQNSNAHQTRRRSRPSTRCPQVSVLDIASFRVLNLG